MNWLQFRGQNGAGYTSNALYPPLGMRWKLRLQENLKEKEARAFNPPLVIDDILYFGSTDGNFYAMDTRTGFMRWIFQTRGRVNSIPYADKDTVYFGSNDTYAYAVDLKTGKERWRFRTGNTIQSLILRYKDSVIFTSDQGATFFLDVSNVPEGSQPPVEYRIPNPVWSHHTFQEFDGVLYWAPQGRGFGAFDIEARKFLWEVDVTAPYPLWYSFPALDDDRVYYGSNFFTSDGSLLHFYAADRRDGSSAWEVERRFEPGPYMNRNYNNYFRRHVYLLDYMAPALYGDTAIYTSGDALVRAFDVSSGSEAWTRRFEYPTSSAPTIAGDRVYLGIHGSAIQDEDDQTVAPRLICLSARSGNILWEMDVEGAILSAPVISGSRIMFGTDKLMFYVLEEVF
ncbi:MAG: PQQ-like beta-propeller repeat protein [Leptospiraceae bacterium]|nr:PQQ-like beta-propeller repeat protein [Leptospiraceae bacterium]